MSTAAHDALDRETTRDVPLRSDGALSDQLDLLTLTWDRNNNLLRVDEDYTVSGRHTTTRTYDAFDRLETVTDRFEREIVYRYDAVGNCIGLDAPNQSTSYSYDALNRLATVTNGAGVTSYSYHLNGRLDRVVDPNGTTARYSYDTANRLESLVNEQGQVEISSYVNGYDDHGNPASSSPRPMVEVEVGHTYFVGQAVVPFDPARGRFFPPFRNLDWRKLRELERHRVSIRRPSAERISGFAL